MSANGFSVVTGGLGYVGDVVVTREEIEGLMAGLLFVDDVPAGTIRLTDWARSNAATLGVRYASELGRRRQVAPQRFRNQ